jgi:hypothetical protein
MQQNDDGEWVYNRETEEKKTSIDIYTERRKGLNFDRRTRSCTALPNYNGQCSDLKMAVAFRFVGNLEDVWHQENAHGFERSSGRGNTFAFTVQTRTDAPNERPTATHHTDLVLPSILLARNREFATGMANMCKGRMNGREKRERKNADKQIVHTRAPC